jgi:hypothetical protein
LGIRENVCFPDFRISSFPLQFDEIWHNRGMPYWFDGNNLIGQSVSSAKADSRTLQAFLSTLSAYRKSGGGRFLVFFDGDDHGKVSTPPGIAVRYSAPLSCDDAIVLRLREIQHPEEAIIVTNDRQLMHRCRDEGASTLDWQRFTNRMNSRISHGNRQHPSPRAQDMCVDVEDWVQYFGLDKKEI